MKIGKRSISIDRVEHIYLAILRISVLAVATLSLLAAIGFALDAGWRFFVNTNVKEEATAVSGAEVARAMRVPPTSDERGEAAIPATVRARHERFATTIFPAYYQIYKQASDRYKKPEDETLSQTDLLSALGYDLDTYASGEVMATKLFVENADYQTQAKTAVTAAMSDTQTVRLLTEYRAAEKTARSCSTQYERRTMWDSNSTACSDWFYQPYGCNVTRSVPIERCVPAYPEGIVSPAVAFGRADDAFRTLWAQRAEANTIAASNERLDREMTRAQIGPRLVLALQIIGAFLVVMFFFLLVAVERHLRRLANDAGTPEEAAIVASPPEAIDGAEPAEP